MLAKLVARGLNLSKWNKLSICTTFQRCFKAERSAVGFDHYDPYYANYKGLNVPTHFNFADDVLQKWCEREKKGERNNSLPAFWWVDNKGEEIQWSFQEMMALANKLSNVLTNEIGIVPGDRIIVVLPRLPEWWLVNIASLQIGAILSPGTISLTAKDLLNRLNASKAKCIITVDEIATLVDQISGQVPHLKSKLIVGKHRSDWLPLDDLMKNASSSFQSVKTKSVDPMAWFFTSGTTGLPKMTEHTHASYGLAHQATGKYWLDLTSQDVMWNLSDTGWAKSAYSSFFAPWWQGSCVFVHHTPRFDARETLDVLKRYPVSVACLPPTAYRMFMQEDLDTTNFKGEPLNPEVIEQWKRTTGLTIREGYGQTEMTLSCGMFRCLDVKPGAIGKATPGYDIQIVNENGEVLEANEEGNVAVKCSPQRPVGLFTRYVDDPERTSAAFCGDFYLTGDRGYKDEDDYIWFVGRADDVIISAGYRIGPFEVESVLIEHPAVAESAVISSPCDVRGEIVKACIVLNAEYENENRVELVEDLQKYVKTSTAPYKYPRKIEFVSSLPKTISGKIRRVELRKKEWER